MLVEADVWLLVVLPDSECKDAEAFVVLLDE